MRLGAVMVGGRVELVMFSDKGLAFRVPEESLRDPGLLLRDPFGFIDKLDSVGVGEPLGMIDELDVLAPLVNPGKVVGVGRNYAAHAEEMGGRAPIEPDIFLKAPSSLTGYRKPIVIPEYVEKPDYEGEIVLVIGSRLKNSSISEAKGAILGYTAGNDVTSRDLQIDRRKPWSMAKSIDTFSPLGPYIKVIDDPGDLDEVCLETRLNGDVMQRGCISDMILEPVRLASYISRYMTLYPGDIIYTGTPPGVGHARSPPRYLKNGDTIEIRVTNLHPLINHVTRI